MTSKIIKMCPKESELLPLGVSQCEICMKQFNNQSRLTMHLRKLHGVEPEIPRVGKCQDIQFQFFCPVIDCKYRKDLYFEALKQLRQHYQRVHLVRNLCCPICTTAKFSLEKDLRYHVRICSKRTPQPKLSSGKQ